MAFCLLYQKRDIPFIYKKGLASHAIKADLDTSTLRKDPYKQQVLQIHKFVFNESTFHILQNFN